MNPPSVSRAEQRIQRVCDHIQQHLDTELSLEQLIEVAALSKYHFHRQFTAITGQSLSKFVQLARLRRAAYDVAFKPQRRFTDIAFDAGFDSLEAFSRAFKREFGQSPSQFQAQPEWDAWRRRLPYASPHGVLTMQVTIIDFPDTPVALAEHRGSPERVMETAERFIAWRKASGLSPVATSRTFGIPYSDPNTTPPEQFRWDVGGILDGDVPDNPFGVKAGRIPGGRCAVVRHYGSHRTLDDSIYALYRDWLPQSGEELRDYPCFFHYVNLVTDVKESELITDIHLPIR
ncbi:AraC family transcriptional regulator [Spongiibacter sp.]|uniref:AraC family transcriptional regulator n=1 Tax=Spongiibacter sp. TaxID=2024860 RepID=UPI000C414CB8|nr:AraC family transcriptional regulator [Spongiibacter sp.]MAY38041.1 AraC family transcriptional regulator [Spongiibacter sp.]